MNEELSTPPSFFPCLKVLIVLGSNDKPVITQRWTDSKVKVKFKFRCSAESGIYSNERLYKPVPVLQSAELLSVEVHEGDQGLVRYLTNVVACLFS